MKERKFSPTMLSALEMATANEHRKLFRHPGGFWTPYSRYRLHDAHHDSGTVEALVRREAMQYSRWQEGRNGRFPIEATMTDSGHAVLATHFAETVGGKA